MTEADTPFKELQELMRRIEESTGLEALAVVTREGIRLACAVSGNVDSDIFSAATATLVNVGEETLRQLSQGTLSEVILRGTKGFTIIMWASPETLLVGASRDQIRLGYYIGLMKIYITKVTKIMETYSLRPEELIGLGRMPSAIPEPTRTRKPVPSPVKTEPAVEVEEPSISIEEGPEPLTVTVDQAEKEENDVSVDDKEAILAALKALGFDEPEEK
ncbi:MAG: roadblock/LC7 domain-containing protein [Promethearchaeota archaeon]